MQYVLGIETSCDDTSVAIVGQNKENGPWQVYAHHSFSQEVLLKKWGGVVPEIAARNHLDKLLPLIELCFETSKLKLNDIKVIGVTTIPGLLGPLLTGLNAAKTLSLMQKIPIVAVNHLFAHLEAIHLTETIDYPYLGLLVSGGHSAYFWVEDQTNFHTLGSTIDDAAGEAFDKGGKILGLGYPAGKTIDQLSHFGDRKAIDFPIALRDKKMANLSFSGLKTSLKNYCQAQPKITNLGRQHQDTKHPNPTFKPLYNTCASYQEAIIQALKIKCKNAFRIAQEKYSTTKKIPLVIGGGVACNSRLREVFQESFSHCHFVSPQYCTDNGAMIAHYAAINPHQAIAFPECLALDARGRYLSKKDYT